MKTLQQLRAVLSLQLLVLARDRRALWLLALASFLVVVALGVGTREAIERRLAVAAANAADLAVWRDQGEKNPHSAAHFGRMVFRPTPPLAALERGLDPYLGTAVWLEAHWRNPFQFRQIEDRSVLARLGDGSAAWLVQNVVALVTILLASSTIAAMRDQGALQLAVTQGLRPGALVLGSWLAATAVAFAALVPVAATVVVTGASDGFVRGLAFLGVHAVWLALVAALGVGISALSRSQRHATRWSVAVWVLACVVAPRLAGELGERRHPTPTPREFYERIAEERTQGLDGHDPEDERVRALEQRTLEQYGVATVAELPVSFAGIQLQASEEYSDEIFDRHFGRLWASWEGQEGWHLRLAWVAPALAVRAISASLAGTDLVHHRTFAEAAEVYRRELVAFLNQDMISNAAGVDYAYMAPADFWNRAPDFHWQELRLADPRVRSVLDRGLVVLAGWVVLVGLGLALASRQLGGHV